MLNEFLNNRKRTFCLRSKKCCTVSYYKKKCQKELEIQMIERKREREEYEVYCNFTCCRLKIQILLSLHALNID